MGWRKGGLGGALDVWHGSRFGWRDWWRTAGVGGESGTHALESRGYLRGGGLGELGSLGSIPVRHALDFGSQPTDSELWDFVEYRGG